jgi:hypothetical protein
MGALSIKDRLAAKRGQIAAGKAKGLRPYKFKGGKTKFRILPNVDPTADWDRRFGKTYLKSFDGQQFFAIGDREITYGETDTIREMLFDAMRQAPDQETKDHYYKMIAKPRIVFNALILDDKDQAPTEPVLIEVSESAFDTILAQFEAYTEMDPDYDLAGQSTGHIFTCEKTGSGLDTKYTFLATPQKAPLKAEIVAKGHDLDAWITSQFEGLEQKALEFLGRLNGAIGITTTVPAGQLTATPAAQQAGAQANAAAAAGVSAAAVTSAIEPEDAAYEEVAADVAAATGADSPFEVDPTPTPAPTPTPTPAAVATKPAATPAAAPAAVTEDSEIEDILAGLA